MSLFFLKHTEIDGKQILKLQIPIALIVTIVHILILHVNKLDKSERYIFSHLNTKIYTC